MDQPRTVANRTARLPAGTPETPEKGVRPSESFEDFFEANRIGLFRALYLICGSTSEAEDVLQDAFVKVWERWDRVGSMERPGGYLFRTAMNRFRSRRRRRVLARSDEAMAERTVRDPIDDSDERDRVLRALGKLPLRQRQAIVLTEYLGFGSDDAAQVLGVRSVTVRSLASQGRATLRERLGVGDE